MIIIKKYIYLSFHQYSFQFSILLSAKISHRHLSKTYAYAIKGNFSRASQSKWLIVDSTPVVTFTKLKVCRYFGEVNCIATMSEIASWKAAIKLVIHITYYLIYDNIKTSTSAKLKQTIVHTYLFEIH